MKLIQITAFAALLVFITPVVEARAGGAARNQAVYDTLDDYEDLHDESVRSVTSPVNKAGGARTEQPGQAGNYALAAPRKGGVFTMGFEAYNYKYRETDDNGQEFMNLKGRFKGIFASMVYRPLTMDAYWGEFLDHYIFDARMAWADLDYTGGVQFNDGGTAPLATTGNPDVVAEFRGMIAKDFAMKIFTLAPYAGFGYRYLKDDSSQITSQVVYKGNTYDVSGYKRESMYIYLPLGLDVIRTFPGKWTVDLNGEYDFFLYGVQKTHIQTAWDGPLSNDQNGGFGARASLRLSKEFTNVGVSFEPFIRYWNIEKSEWAPTEYCVDGQLCNGGIEPANTTREVGVKMGMTF